MHTTLQVDIAFSSRKRSYKNWNYRKLQKIYPADYTLLTTQDLWKAHANLVNKFSEAILKIKCKHGHDVKKCETYGIK